MVVLAATSLQAGKGKLRVASKPSGAYVYVDGKKKAMTGEGFTSILVEAGDHTIRVAMPINENYEYVQTKKVFVGEETSTKLSFILKSTITPHGKAAKRSRWVKQGDVVIDTKLDLVWQDNSEAATVKKTWQGAKRYCANLTYGGKPMRLPTYDELLSIVDYDRYDPAIVPSFKNVASRWYWSSSQDVSDAGGAWYVDFQAGGTSDSAKYGERYVRCVRHR